jgi:hypothetical protein
MLLMTFIKTFIIRFLLKFSTRNVFTTVSHHGWAHYKECSQLVGHKSKCPIIHGNEMHTCYRGSSLTVESWLLLTTDWLSKYLDIMLETVRWVALYVIPFFCYVCDTTSFSVLCIMFSYIHSFPVSFHMWLHWVETRQSWRTLWLINICLECGLP